MEPLSGTLAAIAAEDEPRGFCETIGDRSNRAARTWDLAFAAAIQLALGRIAARRNAAAKRIIKPAND